MHISNEISYQDAVNRRELKSFKMKRADSAGVQHNSKSSVANAAHDCLETLARH